MRQGKAGPIRDLLLILAMMLALSALPVSARAELNDSLWHGCRYTSSGGRPSGLNELWDMNAESGYVVKGPGDVTISWRKSVPARMLYLAWRTLPEPFTLTQFDQDGTQISSMPGETWELNQLYKISPEARSLSITSQTDMDLCSALVYGPNMLPKSYHPWKPTPEKLDYLVIATHPDDDILFLGAIVPILGVTRGLNGTILYTATRSIRYRCDEALNGAWAMGLRNHPLFAGFPNLLPKEQYRRGKEFSVDALTAYYVSVLRRYKPEVVVTQDENGEYGHWQHINVSRAVQNAVSLAADATYDPTSAAEYGTFQVKKLYLHLYPENKLTLNVYRPLPALGGRNVIEVATAAFAEHKSQVKVDHYRVRNDGFYRLSDFGLAFSAVGADTGKNDLLEHIDPSNLSNYVASASIAPPSPAPTLEGAPKEQEHTEPFANPGDASGRRALQIGLTAGAVLAAAIGAYLAIRGRKKR
ncbi:MAG: PIG-L family deacetylase [Christensenella sp.]|nr:PIG-L family deacetylase [Christensenella sp.]